MDVFVSPTPQKRVFLPLKWGNSPSGRVPPYEGIWSIWRILEEGMRGMSPRMPLGIKGLMHQCTRGTRCAQGVLNPYKT